MAYTGTFGGFSFSNYQVSSGTFNFIDTTGTTYGTGGNKLGDYTGDVEAFYSWWDQQLADNAYINVNGTYQKNPNFLTVDGVTTYFLPQEGGTAPTGTTQPSQGTNTNSSTSGSSGTTSTGGAGGGTTVTGGSSGTITTGVNPVQNTANAALVTHLGNVATDLYNLGQQRLQELTDAFKTSLLQSQQNLQKEIKDQATGKVIATPETVMPIMQELAKRKKVDTPSTIVGGKIENKALLTQPSLLGQ